MAETVTTTTSIAGTLRDFSVEVNPSDPKVVDAALDRLHPGTEVFLIWIPGANPMGLVGSAARLRRAGLLPVPQVGARHIESADQLKQLAARLVGEAASTAFSSSAVTAPHRPGPMTAA